MLTHNLRLLFENCLTAVVSQDHEITNRAFPRLKILVEAPCQIIGLENQKYDSGDFA